MKRLAWMALGAALAIAANAAASPMTDGLLVEGSTLTRTGSFVLSWKDINGRDTITVGKDGNVSVSAGADLNAASVQFWESIERSGWERDCATKPDGKVR